MPMVVKAPAMSIAPLQTYFLRLAGEEGIMYHHCVTSLALETDKNAKGTPYARIAPKFVAPLNAEEIEKITLYTRIFQPLVQDVSQDVEIYANE